MEFLGLKLCFHRQTCRSGIWGKKRRRRLTRWFHSLNLAPMSRAMKTWLKRKLFCCISMVFLPKHVTDNRKLCKLLKNNYIKKWDVEMRSGGHRSFCRREIYAMFYNQVKCLFGASINKKKKKMQCRSANTCQWLLN